MIKLKQYDGCLGLLESLDIYSGLLIPRVIQQSEAEQTKLYFMSIAIFHPNAMPSFAKAFYLHSFIDKTN